MLMPSARVACWLALVLSCCAAPAPPTSAPEPPAAPVPSASEVASSGPVVEATPEPPAPPAPPAPVLPMIEGDSLQRLAVEGFAEAVIAVPVGATGQRPVLVATHGNYDRPEWQCEVWGRIVGARGFVLCPRGVRRPDSPSRDDLRYEYGTAQALEREIDAGLSALRQRFPKNVAEGPVVLAGFSLGAILGVTLAARRPEVFSRLVLIEGGDQWTLANARLFGRKGGQRVLFACSQPGCAASARVAVATLRKAEVMADEVKGKSEGHTYVGDVMARYSERFAWVVEGDPRWQ
jgi:pimeloyl-ACP methyl ester carboxylesterase